MLELAVERVGLVGKILELFFVGVTGLALVVGLGLVNKVTAGGDKGGGRAAGRTREREREREMGGCRSDRRRAREHVRRKRAPPNNKPARKNRQNLSGKGTFGGGELGNVGTT